MPKSTSACNSLLKLLFNSIDWDGVAMAPAGSPTPVFWLSLHTADPGVGGSQTTNEAAYTNYARIPVERTTNGWTSPSSGATSNVAIAQFPQCGASGATITHVAIGLDQSGAGQIMYSGSLSSPLTVANLIQPQFAIGDLDVTET